MKTPAAGTEAATAAAGRAAATGKEAARLFTMSFLVLFGELLFIRYLSSNIYLLSYYKNSMLIAIFLGFGIGFMLLRNPRDLVKYVPLATLVLVCAVVSFNDYLRIDLDYGALDEAIWPEFWANDRAQAVPVLVVLAVFYTAMALYFVPFGQETVRLMSRFRPLTAYSINIGGSVAGILAFTWAGYIWAKPLLWFAVLLVPLVVITRGYATRTTLLLNGLATALTLFVVFSAASGPEVWSPYSKVRVYRYQDSSGVNTGFISTTNGNPQVGSMNFDIDYKGPERALNLESRRIYELPYNFMTPSTVLIAGAGAGNETEVALRGGADRVTAVELDPVFVALGSEIAPHRPFTDPRVTVRVDDARAFFQNTTEKYDLVVIGFLDSQYRLAHLSNLRTENFVYTYESLARTKELLTDDGILQLNYNAARTDMRAKLYEMLRDIYGADLAVYVPTEPVSANISYVAGPGVRGFVRPVTGLTRAVIAHEEGGGEVGEGGQRSGPGLSTRWPTDDWPFLYLEKKRIPREYWSMLAMVPLISLGLIWAVGRRGGRGGGGGVFSPGFFLLGAGFMLLETKSITSFALIFGSTINVVSVVLASILSAILVANLVIHGFGLKNPTLPYILTMATIAALYFVPLGPFLTLHGALRLAASSVVIAAPIFFSAMVFGVSFSRSTRIDVDFGSNIFGAVVGGMFEYASMATGFSALYLLSMAAYLGAFVIERRRGGGGGAYGGV